MAAKKTATLAPAWVPSLRLLAPNVTSVTSVGGTEMKPRAVHRYPGIFHTAEENSGKPRLEDSLMKTVQSQR